MNLWHNKAFDHMKGLNFGMKDVLDVYKEAVFERKDPVASTRRPFLNATRTHVEHAT